MSEQYDEQVETPLDLADESAPATFDDDVAEATEGSAEGTAPVETDTDDDVVDAETPELGDEPIADLVEHEGEVADDAVEETVDAVIDGEDDAAAEVEDEPAEDDPLEAFRRELWAKPGDWYVVHTYSGMENRVKSNLENRIVSLNMEDYIHEIVVPIEDIVEIKNGQRRTRKKPSLPGYVLVRMDLTDESWSTVRHTPSVTGFVGNSHQPVPLSDGRGREHARPGSPGAHRHRSRSGRRHAVGCLDSEEAGRGCRLRHLRLGDGRRWSVRHAPRHDHRDQPRVAARQGAGRDLRP